MSTLGLHVNQGSILCYMNLLFLLGISRDVNVKLNVTEITLSGSSTGSIIGKDQISQNTHTKVEWKSSNICRTELWFEKQISINYILVLVK